MFPEKFGTPRQPSLAPSTKGRLVIRSEIDPESFDGIEEFTHVIFFQFHRKYFDNSEQIWLIFVFDKNDCGKGWNFKSKIRAPRLKGEKSGIFATRSPHRYNPIGLSVAKFEKLYRNIIIGNKKHVVLDLSGIDLVHNTSVLDIKPYHPADIIDDISLRYPEWVSVTSARNNFLTVEFQQSAENSLRDIISINCLKFYSDFETIRSAILECLQLDPRTQHSKLKAHVLYGMALDLLDITFSVSAEKVTVLSISLADDSQREKLRTRKWYEKHASLLS